MSVREKIFPFETVFQGENEKFQGLGEKPDGDWNDDYAVVFPAHSSILSKRMLLRNIGLRVVA
jgi:hypothetical protein